MLLCSETRKTGLQFYRRLIYLAKHAGRIQKCFHGEAVQAAALCN